MGETVAEQVAERAARSRPALGAGRGAGHDASNMTSTPNPNQRRARAEPEAACTWLPVVARRHRSASRRHGADLRAHHGQCPKCGDKIRRPAAAIAEARRKMKFMRQRKRRSQQQGP